MIVETKSEPLPELGHVWGDKAAFEAFKEAVQHDAPMHWQPLCDWFAAATRDRGFVLELPTGKELEAVLSGEAHLFGLTIVFGTPEAVEAQIRCGFESYLRGGVLMALGETLELSTHT